MSSYKVSEPSTLKFLEANGAVVDENGNVVSDTSDYWKKVYDQAEPKPDKILHSDGTIKDAAGNLIQDTTSFNVKKYNQAEPLPAKYLHADGTVDENPGSGSNVNLEDNKQVTISENGTTEIKPSSDYDAMKKVTVTTNIPTINKLFCWVDENEPNVFRYTLIENPQVGDKALRSVGYNEKLSVQSVEDISGSKIDVDGDWFIRSPSNDINLI